MPEGTRTMTEREHYQVEIEYTDTFGGQPNYCWVEREVLDIPHETSDRAVMRRCKAAVGLTGVRGRSEYLGDTWEFKPYRSATIMMARVIY